ncbi:hypothetical protein [Arthrobacter sp. MMS18-M83]|uniref:hypothetical protein n=1 Tax=Arthrobacter sp. MMS18-M83 TaxID=2996261 RepID=UPI00227B4F5B|nr:hypothetical protein [Arthrobacter sp. MMS18-M83]WAH96227.1 hypothetical protein OW521_17640 [Arthrobacter sp. MMS18-M83]
MDDPASWGYEEKSRWGTLTTAAGATLVPSEQGAYHQYYEQLALAVAGHGPQPVPGIEPVHTLEILDAARLSDTESRTVDITAQSPKVPVASAARRAGPGRS